MVNSHRKKKYRVEYKLLIISENNIVKMTEIVVNGNSKLSDKKNDVSRKAEEIEIPVPWGKVSAKWWGPRDKRPILAIHGWQDNAGTWEPLAKLLPLDVALLCIDLPGHGRSSHYPPGQHYYLFWDGISLIRRIVKYYNWPKVTLLGHSLGGALSFMYAASFPEDVDKYISVDIASPTVRDTGKIVTMTGGCIDKFLDYENLTADKLPCYTYEEMIDLVYEAYGGSCTRESCEILMKRGMEPTPPNAKKKGFHFTRDVRLKVALLGMMTIEQVMEYATRIKCQVLNIRATPGLKWDNPVYYQMVLDKIKETAQVLEYREVDGTHHVHLNDPEKIVEYVLEFIEY